MNSMYGSFKDYTVDFPYMLEEGRGRTFFFRFLEAFFWVFTSAACFGFGNGLEPISPLAWLHSFFLLVGFNKLVNCTNWIVSVFITLILHSLGVVLGFASLFYANGVGISEAIGSTFGFGLGIWLVVILTALLPSSFFNKRFPGNILTPFVYPAAVTSVFHVIVGLYLSSFPSLATAVIDYAPLKQIGSIFGAAGINFVTVFAGSLGAYKYIRHKIPSYDTVIARSSFVFFLLITVTSFLIQSDNIYQRDVSHLIRPTLNVSCVFAQSKVVGSSGWEDVWSVTESRVLAGDQIVMWSETALTVSNADTEESIFLRAKSILSKTNSTYLGITYLRQFGSYDENHFVLLTPHGELAWNYRKAHPVPVVESTVRAGPSKLPTHKSTYGTLSGAICFDLDYPQFIRQASVAGVDIFLQPSWTWGAIDNRHFDGDSLRAVENGFTLFRCSSDGVSGVVSPRGVVWSRAYTGHDPRVSAQFSLPLVPRVQTFYAMVGFIFEWVCFAFTVVILLVTYPPVDTVHRVLFVLFRVHNEHTTDSRQSNSMNRIEIVNDLGEGTLDDRI